MVGERRYPFSMIPRRLPSTTSLQGQIGTRPGPSAACAHARPGACRNIPAATSTRPIPPRRRSCHVFIAVLRARSCRRGPASGVGGNAERRGIRSHEDRGPWDITGPVGAEPTDITGMLQALSTGDERVRGSLIEAVYGELRRLARGYLRRERP